MVCFYELFDRESERIRADAIDELENLISKRFWEYSHEEYDALIKIVMESAEELKSREGIRIT